MQIIRFRQLIQITSIVAGVIGLTIDAGYASEIDQPTETDQSTETTSSVEAIVPSPEFQAEQIAAATFEAAALPIAATPISQSEQPGLLFDPVSPVTRQYAFQTEPLVKPIIDIQRSDFIALTVTDSDSETATEHISSNSVNLSDPVQMLPEFESLNSNSADLGEAQFVDHQPIAQTEVPAESNSSEPASESEESSPRWRFTFTPYAFVPVSVEGSATLGDFTADINLGLSDVLSPLNFAAAGRTEAWRGNLGLIFDASYFKISQENSSSLSIPNCLCDIFPSEITTDITVQYGQFDLGVGYRVAENAKTAANEFELGPLVFDAIVGIRIYALQQEINVSTNLGTERNRERSTTLIEPLISGRFRWNLSPKLAGWVRGDLAGLGIGGTLMAASFTGGIDWMFAGDTSLLLAYRFSSLNYTNENFDLSLLFNGPYLGVTFRF